MSPTRIGLLVVGVVLISLAATSMADPSMPADSSPDAALLVCKGKYRGGLKPSPDELVVVLNQHTAWVEDGGSDNPKLANDPRRANLCGADLRYAPLHGANLSGATLEGAELRGANLSGAIMYGTNLKGATLYGTNLEGANLLTADLDGAILEGVDVRGANLSEANLSRTDLSAADLRGADLDLVNLHGADLLEANLGGADLVAADLRDAALVDADLTGADLREALLNGANLRGANLDAVNFEFDPDSPPKPVPVGKNLQLVIFHDDPAGLVKLRSEFKELGMRTQEAQLTYAIRRSELYRKTTDNYWSESHYVHGWSERVINTAFFDWTCQYGMSPGRPLLIVAALAVILSILYLFAQIDPGPNGGIWAVWDEYRINQSEGSKEPQQLTDGFPSATSNISFILLAFYFSFLSATRIGWHELNVGTWITRIQPREYTLRATGWVRVVSGVQSLISVYLVALAILTYFGTPFEY